MLILRTTKVPAMVLYEYSSIFLPGSEAFVFSSPEHKLRVSYCHHTMSVVRRRPSFVVNN